MAYRPTWRSIYLAPTQSQKDLVKQALWKERKVSNTGLQGRSPLRLVTSQYSLELLLPFPPREEGKHLLLQTDI